jgi:hypothetical protein
MCEGGGEEEEGAEVVADDSGWESADADECIFGKGADAEHNFEDGCAEGEVYVCEFELGMLVSK